MPSCFHRYVDGWRTLPILVDHFVKLFGRELAKPVRTVPPDTMELLKAYDWPGNVRELQSAVKYAFVQATGDVLAPHWLPENVRRGRSAGTSFAHAGNPPTCPDIAELTQSLIRSGSNDVYRQVQMKVDRILLDEVLRHVDGNQVLASQILGISRTTLRSKLSMLESSCTGNGIGP